MSTTPSNPEPTSPPPPRGKLRSYLLVLCTGLATTVMTLFGIYWMDIHWPDFHIMGFYLNYVIPAGALLVGIVAALGYGISSSISGVKIVRGLLWTVLLFQFVAYFAAEYVEFRNMDLVYRGTNKPVGFFEYFDMNARSFAWKGKDGEAGSPLGVWGYAFRGLEIIGFACGGLLVPLALFKKPYCNNCERYMKNRTLAMVPGSVKPRKVKKSDIAGTEALKAEQEKAYASAQELLTLLRQMAADGHAADFQKATDALKARRKETAKLPIRYQLSLTSCKQCAAGWLGVSQMVGQGKQLSVTALPVTNAPPEFIAALR